MLTRQAANALVLGLALPHRAYAAPIITFLPYGLHAGNYGGSEMSAFVEATQFTLSSPADIAGIRFWSVEEGADPFERPPSILSSYNGSISWILYSDGATVPGLQLASGSTSQVTRARISTGSIYEEYENVFPVDGVVLGPGTYWLGLHDGQLSETVRTQFYWEVASNFDVDGLSRNDPAPFDGAWNIDPSQRRFSLAFELFGPNDLPPSPTPEPSTLLLLGTGLAGLSVTTWRRARRT